jgi:hypothetical protein
VNIFHIFSEKYYVSNSRDKRYYEPRIHLRDLLIGSRSLFLRWDQQPISCDQNNDFDFYRKTLTQRWYPHQNMSLYLTQFLSWWVISMPAQYGFLILRPLADGSTAIIPVHPLFWDQNLLFLNEFSFPPLFETYLSKKKTHLSYDPRLSLDFVICLAALRRSAL